MDASVNKNRSRLLRIAGLAALVIIVVIIVLTMVIFPRMENFFLRKGLEFAREKTLAALPAEDGFNPDLHPVDPMLVRTSLTFLRESLDIDSLATSQFQGQIKNFMTLFKNCYNDQIIKPEEAATIAASLDTLQRNFLKVHFDVVRNNLARQFQNRKQADLAQYMEILGFDSIAIFREDIKLGLTGPYTVNLINVCFQATRDNNVIDDEYDDMINAIHDIERFQLRNEFQAAGLPIFDSPEFKQFPEVEQFRNNVRIILNRLRDMDYKYDEIKSTLRSFIFLWYERAGSVRDVPFDLKNLFELTKYAAAHAQMKR